MTEALLIAAIMLSLINTVILILLFNERRSASRELDRLRRDIAEEQRALRAEISESTRRSIATVGDTLLNEYQRDTVNQEQRFKTFALENAQRMEQIRSGVERQLTGIREDNGKKLDEMRQVVDEKLQKTLEDKLSRSFALVSERLEQVYKGLGEMQTLAAGVGDLSKVLSNVKTRGILGEIQLGAILGAIRGKRKGQGGERRKGGICHKAACGRRICAAARGFKVSGGRIYEPYGRIRAGQCRRR